ncbi:ATP-binding protein [Streptomyces sp. NPDC001268]|uniref:ATP-binding protein n=1 Tax=Streptomyces sp. NPDC001268 TaxID=3364553 RepID=UPI0036C1B7F0
MRRLNHGAAIVLWRWTSFTSDAPSRARIALRCALEQLGCDPKVISDTVLAVSELVANAVEHGRGPYELRLRQANQRIICEVEDHDPCLPEIEHFAAASPYLPREEDRGGGLDALCSRVTERGRGLQIVNVITGGCWGFLPTSNATKSAWLMIPLE